MAFLRAQAVARNAPQPSKRAKAQGKKATRDGFTGPAAAIGLTAEQGDGGPSPRWRQTKAAWRVPRLYEKK